MSETMVAVRLHAPGDLRVDEVAIPQPGPGQVLVKVHRCGICGTDLHITKGNFPAPNLPLVLGHEFSGTVTETGPGTDQHLIGSRVVVDINIACGHCYYCRRGQKLFCPDVEQLGVHNAGGLAEYVVAPAANLHVLPAGLPLDTATYVEPLACAVHGQDRVGVRSGDTVLILGGGPMGLAHTALSRLSGASTVIVSELDGDRSKRAAALGADQLINPFETPLADAVAELTDGIGPDIVIEAVGSVATYESAVAVVRRGGRMLAYGAPPQTATMSLRPFDIYDTWPRAIELLAAGRFDPSLIVDSIRPLSESVEAIHDLERDRSTVKVHIQV
jgi:2-desacetyl-2-hydroxyethyl bacteriochlorophyllide A dehydrogenase